MKIYQYVYIYIESLVQDCGKIALAMRVAIDIGILVQKSKSSSAELCIFDKLLASCKAHFNNGAVIMSRTSKVKKHAYIHIQQLSYQFGMVNIFEISLWSVVLHICMAGLGHYWFRWWVVASSATNYCINQWWILIDHSPRKRLQ